MLIYFVRDGNSLDSLQTIGWSEEQKVLRTYKSGVGCTKDRLIPTLRLASFLSHLPDWIYVSMASGPMSFC